MYDLVRTCTCMTWSGPVCHWPGPDLSVIGLVRTGQCLAWSGLVSVWAGPDLSSICLVRTGQLLVWSGLDCYWSGPDLSSISLVRTCLVCLWSGPVCTGMACLYGPGLSVRAWPVLVLEIGTRMAVNLTNARLILIISR